MLSQFFKTTLYQKRLSLFDFFLLLLFVFFGLSISYKFQTAYKLSEIKLIMKMETLQMSMELRDSNIQMRKRMDKKITKIYQDIQSMKLKAEEFYNEKKDMSQNERF